VSLAARQKKNDVRYAAADEQAFCLGKLAAANYFFRYELPKVAAWLEAVRSRDALCKDLPDEYL
jgi:butyryl-CoA dehydrogenase